jgi:hypothetical protein
MQRIVTAIFALVLAAGAVGPVPASRSVANGGSSSAIVWIAREKIARENAEQARHAEPRSADLDAASPAGGIEYQSRRATTAPDFARFQRPPPTSL